MTVTLGAPPPSRIGVASNTDANFPDTAGTWTSPDGAIVIPGAALDRWWAYRATRGATRKDFPIFGDSTWYGSNDYGEGNRSVQQYLRLRASSWGMADGGKGIYGAGESSITYAAPEVNGVVSSGFNFVGDQFDLLAGQFFADVTAGHTVSLQFYGDAFRLWYMRRSPCGEFTYSLDGGGAVTVNAWKTGNSEGRFVYVSGLNPSTLHTLTITNRGGRTADPPGSPGGGLGAAGSGTFSAATYYYVVTNVFGGGETLASPVSAMVDDGSLGGRSHGVNVADIGQDSCNLYRGTSSGGPFGLMSLSNTTGGGLKIFLDDGSTSPNMAVNPPVSGTTNLNTSSPRALVGLAPLKTGLAFQKVATSGATMFTFMSTTASPWNSMGLTYDGVGSLTSASSYTVDATTGAVNPVCAMIDLGFNDMVDASTVAQVTNGINIFAAMCQAASCDGIVCSGNLPYKAQWATTGPAHFNALKNAAAANGLVFVDLFYPVGGPSLSYAGGVQSPHLHLAAYSAQADYLWDNLLGMV